MFSYALRNNQNDTNGLRKTLLSVIPHAYGDHSTCSETWCGYLKEPGTYKHASLPYGKDLTCEETRRMLCGVFDGLAAHSERLAPLGSSQSNESLNNTIASKAPKSRCHGGSESHDFRTAAAVLQKNEGHGYVAAVVSQAKYSPSKNAATLAAQRNKKECARKVVASSKAGKLQRRKLRLNRSNAQETSELREGTTYSSACTLATGNEDIDTESIPAPVTAPSLQPLVWNPEYVTVCFDLETTSLLRSSQLTQIAARVHGSDSCPAFSIYLLPTEAVSPAASEVTGLAVATIEGERVLTANGKRVTALSQRDGLQALIDWLENLSKSVVVAHNCHTFDMRVLSNALMREGLQADFEACVHGFGDSLPALKCALPSRSSYKLADIHMSVCKHNFPAHDASHDVTALVDVLRVVKADLVPTFVTVGSVITVMAFEAEKLKRQATFGALVKAKVLSSCMASKAAASGLTAHHLQVAYRRDSALGIERLFKEKTAVGRRVTATKRIISGVNEFLSH